VALLRAINVGGKSVLKMDALRDIFESLGFEEVSTYIQTGNVVFAGGGDDARLARKIEKGILEATGYETTAFVRTAAELRRALRQSPFPPGEFEADWRIHFMFLADAPTAARRKALAEVSSEHYRFEVKGKVLYYAYPRAVEGRQLRRIDFEKVLGTHGTARTWKVVAKLAELAG
jgi:uncharacterized protein (DUF1697 family)